MSKRRDRHARGIRGPLARPNELSGAAAPLHKRPTHTDIFKNAIQASVERIEAHCPQALINMDVGYEDVPSVLPSWEDRAPLASATPVRPPAHGFIVLYRRPIEFRSPSREDLNSLVHHTLVEQLSAVTGIPTDELDPDASRDDWDD